MRTAMILLVGLASAACTTKNAANRTDSTVPAAATVASSSATTTNLADVRRFVDSAKVRYIDAATKGDVAGLSSFYTDDAMVLAPNAKLVSGRSAIDESNRQMFAAMKVAGLKLTSTDLQSSGDFVVETGAYDQTLQPKTGKPIHDVGKYIVVWKKQGDGSWKLFREIYNTDLAAKM